MTSGPQWEETRAEYPSGKFSINRTRRTQTLTNTRQLFNKRSGGLISPRTNGGREWNGPTAS